MVLPFPAQGHVIPLMELSSKLTEHGLEVDFVNTEFNHVRILESMAEDKGAIPDGIRMLSIPDGLGPEDDHADIGKFVRDLPAAMSNRLEEMIRSNKTKWVIVDVSMSWALEVATTAGARVASFSTYSAAVFALRVNLPKLIEDGVLDESGNVNRQKKIQMMPPIDASRPPAGHFLPEDLSCLAWLDAQPPSSVVYVAFGSSGFMDATQFQELADGLAHCGRPFLWVVRPKFTTGGTTVGQDWFDAFKRRVDGKGLVVGWAPQQRVLSHPSVACFMSHCGWNSTVDGVRHGVPFLCWPYFADQFCNQSYVCNVWGTGVKLRADRRGVVTGEEMVGKVEQLLGDEEIKARAAIWKDKACGSIAVGGSSH